MISANFASERGPGNRQGPWGAISRGLHVGVSGGLVEQRRKPRVVAGAGRRFAWMRRRRFEPLGDRSPSVLPQQQRPLCRRGLFSGRNVRSGSLVFAQDWPGQAVLLLEGRCGAAAGGHGSKAAEARLQRSHAPANLCINADIADYNTKLSRGSLTAESFCLSLHGCRCPD